MNPKVSAEKPDLKALAKAAESHDVGQRWAERLRRETDQAKKRHQRLLALRPGIDTALEAYAELPGTGEVTEIRLRVPFVRLTTAPPLDRTRSKADEIKSRPPSTKLIAAAGSRALPTYLSILYVAQMQREAGGKLYHNTRHNIYANEEGAPWVHLAGFRRPHDKEVPARIRQRKERISLNTALGTLAKYGLIALGSEKVAGQYDGFRVLSDDGRMADYRVPSEGSKNKDLVRLPESFFRNGWHLVLTPAETAVLLAIVDRTNVFSQRKRSGGLSDLGIDLKESVRESVYRISDEAYEAVHALNAYGLIDMVDPMPNRRSFRAASTQKTNSSGHADSAEHNQLMAFRLVYPPRSDLDGYDPFNRDAFKTVDDVVTALIPA